MQSFKARIYLLEYRIKNNDKKLKQRLYFFIFSVFLLSCIVLFNMFEPLERLKKICVDRFASISISQKQEVNERKENISSSLYIKPVDGVITSAYGYRANEFHTGIDVSCYTHRDNVRVVSDGVVVFAGVQTGYGNCIEVEHVINGKKIYSFYAHLSKIRVNVSQKVCQGDIIANEGGDPRSDPNPGNSTGHHLHFELRKSLEYGSDIDPTFVFN